MSRPKKILAIIGASLGGLIIILLLAAVIVLQSNWFANFTR